MLDSYIFYIMNSDEPDKCIYGYAKSELYKTMTDDIKSKILSCCITYCTEVEVRSLQNCLQQNNIQGFIDLLRQKRSFHEYICMN